MVLRSFLLLVLIAAGSASCSSNPDHSEETASNESTPSKNEIGKELFSSHCISCHGEDGKLGLSGAGDLSKSRLSDNELMGIIKGGRKGMPAMGPVLGNESAIQSVAAYVKELRH